MRQYDMQEVIRMKTEGMTWREIGGYYAEEGEEAYSIGERIRSHYRRANKNNLQRQRVLRSQSEKGQTTSYCSSVQILSDEELLRAHGYDPTKWDIVDCSTALNGKGGSSSRIKVKPKEQLVDTAKIREMFNDIVPVYVKRYDATNEHKRRDTLIVPLFDMHYGRWAMGNNDIPIGVFETNLVNRLISLKEQYLNVVLLIGQDMFNSDTVRNATTLGTKLDPAERFEEAYKKGYAFMCTLYKFCLENFKNVSAYYTYGNHDRSVGYAMAVGLQHMFPDVDTHISAKARTYFMVDNVLVGVTHGDGLVSINGVMSNEAPEMWGKSTERAWIIGHKHTFKVEEKEGMTVYNVPSPCVTDDWHDNKGYQSKQRMVMLGVGKTRVNGIYIC